MSLQNDIEHDELGIKPPAAVVSLHNNIMKAINKHYPSWAGTWKIAIDTHGGVVRVRNMAISGKMGFLLKIKAIDPEMRKVVHAAGELFERYRIARDRGTKMRDEIEQLRRSGTREAIYDE